MESWSRKLVRCRSREGASYYLKNQNTTSVKISRKFRSFDILKIFKKLEEIEFPFRYTNGLVQINFTHLRDYGEYFDGVIWIDIRKGRRFKTLIETVIHEIAHHVDANKDNKYSCSLHKERKRRGKHVHSFAKHSDEEYFARGFERFYSMNPQDKIKLKKNNPQLYRSISALHERYRSKC